MNQVSDIQDLQLLVDNLYENNIEILNDSLQRLILFTQSNKKDDILPYFGSLFERFPRLLVDENLSVVVQTSQLLIELSTQFSKEIEPYFHHVLENLIINLADHKTAIRKMASNSICTFIQMTKNCDLVFVNLTKYGILHANPNVRQKAIMAINNFVLADPTCIGGSIAFKSAIEKVIEKGNESIDTVRSAAYQVISHLNNNYKNAFNSLTKKLSFGDQEKMRKVLESSESSASLPANNENTFSHSRSPNRVQNSDLDRTGTPRKLSEVGESPNRVQKTFKMTTKKTNPLPPGKNSLRFGLFDNKLIEDANNSQDWRVRLAATEEIMKVIESLQTTDVLAPHLEDFLGLLTTLMNDVNFKIYINSLNIIGIIVKMTKKNDLAPHIERIVTVLLDKLGDSKVAVRQIAFQILVLAAKKIEIREYLSLISTNLKETNWHMREESLLLIQMTFNSIPEELPMQIYEETIESVIEVLDDAKPKVRNTARETIITLIRHSQQPIDLLNKIQPFLEKELYEYMVSRIRNPENFPRTTYTPYTDDSGLEQRESLNMTHKMDSTGILENPNARTTSNNINFRSMTTSPRDIAFMNMAGGTNNSRQNMDTVYSASPYKKSTGYDYSSQFQGNSTGYSNSSSTTTYYNHHQNTDHNNKYGNRSIQASTPYDKKMSDQESISPNLSNFSTPYTKGNVYTPESNQRPVNAYTNQSGYQPKVQTPYQNQNQKSGYDISTASSSRSAYSRNTNTVYSFENSSISNSSVLTGNKQSRQAMNYANMLDTRIQSAQLSSDMVSNMGVYGADKRILNTAEDQAKAGFSNIQNKLTSKVPANNKDVYLEYSITRKLDDFPTNYFESQGSLTNIEHPMEPGARYGGDNVEQDPSQHDNRFKSGTNNPYRGGTRPDFAQKIKKFQAQHNQVIMETDESRKTLAKENESTGDRNGKFVEKKPPLPLHKRGVSEKPNKELDKTGERDEGSDDDSMSMTKNSSKGLKRKPTQKSAEGPAIVDYKKLEYLTKEQLEPLEGNLEGALKTMNNDLKSDDWQKQFEASNTLRRFLQYHYSFLSTSLLFNLHATTQDILKMVESLRSNLAKNALITLTEMCVTLKKQLDTESELIIAKLIKKGSDANSFINEEVRKAFVAVSQNCSEAKIVPILVSILNQKASPAKINICLCVESIITKNESRINQIRDFDKLVIILGNYMLDSAVEVRNASKQAMSILLRYMFNQSEVDKLLQRNFSEANYNRLNTIITKELNQANSSLMITNYQATAKNRSASFKPKGVNSKNSLDEEEEPKGTPQLKDNKESPAGPKTKKVLKSGTREIPELENLPNVFAQAELTDWKSRYDAAQTLKDVGTRYADNLAKSKLQLKYFDCFTKLILDSNTKVSSFAISSFTELVPSLKSAMEANLTNILNASLTSLGSVNPTVKAVADTLFETLSNQIDSSLIVPIWANCLPFTNPRAKVSVLNKLNEMCPTLYSRKIGLITKNVIPALSKLVEETKADVRSSTQQVFQTLYGLMNKDLLEYVPPNKTQIVFDIVSGK